MHHKWKEGSSQKRAAEVQLSSHCLVDLGEAGVEAEILISETDWTCRQTQVEEAELLWMTAQQACERPGRARLAFRSCMGPSAMLSSSSSLAVCMS